MPKAIQPAVVGATGYAGFELARLLARHPLSREPVLFTRNGEAGATVGLEELYPHVSGNGGYPLEPLHWEALRAEGVDWLFPAEPHEVPRDGGGEAIEFGGDVHGLL